MTWTYSGDPKSSDRDRFRFLLSDTDQREPVLQDEEIQFIIDDSSSENEILYRLFDAAANVFSRDIKKSLGPQSQDPVERQKHFARKAEQYRRKLLVPGISLPKSTRIVFSKGMHDNV